MSTWGYRIRFICTWKNMAVDPDGERLTQGPTGPDVRLKAIQGRPGHFAIRGSGFASEASARHAGRQMKQALLIAGMRTRWSVDVGLDKATTCFSEEVRAAAYAASGVRILNDVHGLCVFEENSPVSFGYSTGQVTFTTDPREFVDALRRATETVGNGDDRLDTALTLFNLARFEVSARAKFLTLIMAVEALARPARRSDTEVEIVRRFVQELQDSHPEFNSLISSLGALQNQSISSACGRLFSDELGSEAAQRFRLCYRVRSALTHGRKLPHNGDPASLLPVLQTDLRDLLNSLLRRSSGAE